MPSGVVPASGESQTLAGRQREVARLLHSIGKASDPVSFQAYVFAAQRGRVLSTDYEFSFSRNLPLSVDLSWDLERMIRERFIIDTHRANTILVHDEAAKNLDKVESPLLDRLATTDPGVVLTLARLIWLTKDRGIPLKEAGRSLEEEDMVHPECVREAMDLYEEFSQHWA